MQQQQGVAGERDGARTRDLRRDRPAKKALMFKALFQLFHPGNMGVLSPKLKPDWVQFPQPCWGAPLCSWEGSMADKTGIEWTDATWNPIVGCSILSPGCTNCYAMSMAARIERMHAGTHYAGTTRVVNGKPVWTGKLALAPEHILTQPLRWKRPRSIFVNSMSDLFHAGVPDEWIDRVFAVMALSPPAHVSRC